MKFCKTLGTVEVLVYFIFLCMCVFVCTCAMIFECVNALVLEYREKNLDIVLAF